MIKLCTFTVSHLAYNVPVVRQATIYGECEAGVDGCTFEVSTHTGNMGTAWDFKPCKTLEEAQLHALRFLSPSALHSKINA